MASRERRKERKEKKRKGVVGSWWYLRGIGTGRVSPSSATMYPINNNNNNNGIQLIQVAVKWFLMELPNRRRLAPTRDYATPTLIVINKQIIIVIIRRRRRRRRRNDFLFLTRTKIKSLVSPIRYFPSDIRTIGNCDGHEQFSTKSRT